MEAAESVASSAVKTAIDLKASMVIVLTETGTTARMLAKYRPHVPILAFTASHTVAKQMNGYLRNVYPEVLNDGNSNNTSRILHQVLLVLGVAVKP